jgi:hypothetical protein
VPAAPEIAWRTVDLGELRFESPVDLGPEPAIADAARTNHPGLILSCEAHQGQLHGGEFLVLASVTTYAESVQPDLDGAASGAITGGLANLRPSMTAEEAAGVAAPAVATVDLRVSGLPASRATFRTSLRGRPLHIHSLAVGKDKTVWAVMVLHTGDAAVGDAERIRASVQVDPGRGGRGGTTPGAGSTTVAPTPRSSTPPPPAVAPDGWTTTDLGEIRLDTPMPLREDRKSAEEVRAENPEAIRSVLWFQGERPGAEFSVAVNVFETAVADSTDADDLVRASVTGSLGHLRSIARPEEHAALDDPDVETSDAAVSGLRGRRGSRRALIGGTPWHVQSLCVTKAAAVWTVLVVHRKDEPAADATRVLESVRIEPGRRRPDAR